MATKNVSTDRTNIGNYDLLEKIAEGGMGVVHKARNRETNEIVAVKVLKKEVARNPVLLKRFEQEFRVASKLDHPNIVAAIEYCDTGDVPYLVLEYVEGASLGEILAKDGRMSEKESVKIILQIA